MSFVILNEPTYFASFILIISICPVCTVKLNGNRSVRGILRGFDPFMNVVLETTEEVLPPGQGERFIGMVVSILFSIWV